MASKTTVKFILPALIEAESPFWRPIKYSLFPPLGLVTLASYFDDDFELVVVDQHVEPLNMDDRPDLVFIQVYITNAYRAYAIATEYRKKGAHVCLGGLHVTALPDEARQYADTIFLGPAEESITRFIQDYKQGTVKKEYVSTVRTLEHVPPLRRDLIKRALYFVPNSIVVSRGCPHHCDFCYKDGFFKQGKSFYVQRVDDALAEIERLPGRHLYFLDDHLLGNPRFASALFKGMEGMNRIFQGAATIQSILDGDLIEKAAKAGLRSLFIGIESFSADSLTYANKHHNVGKDVSRAIRRLHDSGVMINGSFVFGLDGERTDVFKHTVDWAVKQAITTATFHIATPYPGTRYYDALSAEGRITSHNWSEYDTRTVVFRPKSMTSAELKTGYDWAYKEFYSLSNIFSAGLNHESLPHIAKHLAYTIGWKKMEPIWNAIIKTKGLNYTLPLLEAVLTKIRRHQQSENAELREAMHQQKEALSA